MHGVGGVPVQKAFRAFSHKDFIPVVEQMEPDPEFPTVSFPNPEEGKSALVGECSLLNICCCLLQSLLFLLLGYCLVPISTPIV